MLTFDSKQMKGQIDPLPKRLRVAFAAACTQRQLLNYVQTSAANPTGDPEAVKRILLGLWECVEHNVFEPEKIRHDLVVCEALTPSHDTESFPGMEFAQRALLSLAYAFDTALLDDSQEAVWAAQCAVEALDDYARQRFSMEHDIQGRRPRLASIPIEQAELSRQQADLEELHAAANDPGNEAAVIVRIRRRAEKDASSFFG